LLHKFVSEPGGCRARSLSPRAVALCRCKTRFGGSRPGAGGVLCGEAGRHSICGSRTWACSCLGRPHSASQTARGSPAPHAIRFARQREREPAVACCTPEHTTPPDASALHLASQTARRRRAAGAPPGRRGPGRTSWLEMEVMVAAASSIIRHVACLQAQARGRGERVSWANGAGAGGSARAGRRWSGRRWGGRGRRRRGAARAARGGAPPLVPSGHAASLTPY
jgi:hypothetical protein